MREKALNSLLDDLTEMQRTFVIEYAADGNGARACKEAGYSGDSSALSVRATRMLKMPKICAALAEFKRPYMIEAGLTVESLTRQLAYCIFRDDVEFLDDEGYIKCRLKDLPKEYRLCIEKWECRNILDDEGNVIGQRIKPEFVSRKAAMELGMKHLGMLRDMTVNINQQNNFWDILASDKTEEPNVIEAKFEELTRSAQSVEDKTREYTNGQAQES